jgi:uncharacterized pyridoxamine 5'-phosphate oxidase family protein
MEQKMHIEFLRDSAVATLATLQAGKPTNCGSIPWQTQRFFSLLQNAHV